MQVMKRKIFEWEKLIKNLNTQKSSSKNFILPSFPISDYSIFEDFEENLNSHEYYKLAVKSN